MVAVRPNHLVLLLPHPEIPPPLSGSPGVRLLGPFAIMLAGRQIALSNTQLRRSSITHVQHAKLVCLSSLSQIFLASIFVP